MSDLTLSDCAPAIKLLTLNRPERLNALSYGLVRELHEAFDALAADDSCRVIVLTGAGRAFCAGLDLKEQAGAQAGALRPDAAEHGAPGPPRAGPPGPAGGLRFQALISGLVPKIRSLRQPVVAAVNGAAVGGGLGLALAADIRVMAASARLGVQFIKVGVSGCDIGVSYTLPRLVGASRAFELMLTGRLIDAAEAERIGLVSRVTGDEAVVAEAVLMAEAICGHSPFGVTMTKEVMWANLDAPSLESAIALENRTQILSSYTGDLAEAAAAFTEKRPPKWRGT